MKIILDPGSTHDGDLHKALRLIEIAAATGADAIKFQLLSPAECKGGNVPIDWEWFPELIEAGKKNRVEVFASVFDQSGWDYVIKCGCKSVKLSHSQAHRLSEYHHKIPLETIYISRDVMSREPHWNPKAHAHFRKGSIAPLSLVQLYCLPIYPVPYVVDFEGLFPRFDGFSSHCLGIQQEIRAADAGAKCLEFHFQGDWTSNTPDGRFAKSPAMVEKICKAVKK